MQRRKSGTQTKRVNWFKKVYTPVVKKVYTQASNLVEKVYTPVAVHNKLSSISMLKIFQATIRKSFLVSQSFLIDVNFFKWEAPVAGIRLSLSKATITGLSFSAGIKGEFGRLAESFAIHFSGRAAARQPV